MLAIAYVYLMLSAIYYLN